MTSNPDFVAGLLALGLILPGGGCSFFSDPPTDAKPDGKSRYGNPSSYVVFGTRYHVLDSADGYVERGLASWYGPNFHGKKTSSGEIFDMYQPSAAHKSLPLPTWVKVTHTGTGRSINVRVNDRGPFKDGRIIDLSYKAALELGIAKEGLAPVEVRAIRGPQSPPSHPGRTLIQLGAFSSQARAESFMQELLNLGLTRLFIQNWRPASPLHMVFQGPFDGHAKLTQAIDKLEALGVTEYMTVILPDLTVLGK